LGQDRRDRTVRQVRPTVQPGQVSLERTEMADSQEMTIASGEQWTRVPRRAARKGGQSGQDRLVRTGDLGEDIWDRTTVIGQQRQVGLDKSA
jgi:hypothetical protein